MNPARRWAAATALGLLLGGAAAWWAGSVFDAPLDGASWRFGPWAVLWGTVALLVGVALGASVAAVWSTRRAG